MNTWMNFIRGIAGDLQPVLTAAIAFVLIGAAGGCGVAAYNHYKRQRRHRHRPRINSRIVGLAYVAGTIILVLIGLSLILANLG